MLKYSEKDATRINELQEITSQFRKSLMFAIAWKLKNGTNWKYIDDLQQLRSEAREAQNEIDGIVLRNFRHHKKAYLLSSPMRANVSGDNCNNRCGHQTFDENQRLGYVSADNADPQGQKCNQNKHGSCQRSDCHLNFHD